MNNIDICVIGRKTPDFTEHLTIIRHISGLKVIKRRNKPFYDITGEIASNADFNTMAEALQYMLTHCEAELDIKDKDLQRAILEIIG